MTVACILNISQVAFEKLISGKGVIARNPFREKGQHRSCIKNTLLEPVFLMYI